MPMPKAKPKMVSGVLCRDKDNYCRVVFAPEATRKDVALAKMEHRGGSIWCTHENYPGGFSWQFWSLEDWKATYDLAPPRKGRAFEAELEL